MTLKSCILLFLMLLLLISCDEKRVFDEYKSVENNWKKDSIVTFSFNQKDTTSAYNLFVNIRNNNEYPFSNLFLIVSLQQPGGLTKVDTLQYEMANPDGTLLGQGLSDIKENKLFYKEKLKFKKIGIHKISIQQAVRKTGTISNQSLQGVLDVGFRIESL